MNEQLCHTYIYIFLYWLQITYRIQTSKPWFIHRLTHRVREWQTASYQSYHSSYHCFVLEVTSWNGWKPVLYSLKLTLWRFIRYILVALVCAAVHTIHNCVTLHREVSVQTLLVCLVSATVGVCKKVETDCISVLILYTHCTHTYSTWTVNGVYLHTHTPYDCTVRDKVNAALKVSVFVSLLSGWITGTTRRSVWLWSQTTLCWSASTTSSCSSVSRYRGSRWTSWTASPSAPSRSQSAPFSSRSPFFCFNAHLQPFYLQRFWASHFLVLCGRANNQETSDTLDTYSWTCEPWEPWISGVLSHF